MILVILIIIKVIIIYFKYKANPVKNTFCTDFCQYYHKQWDSFGIWTIDVEVIW